MFIEKKKMIHQTNNGSHLRITTYIKPKQRRQRDIETYKCPICDNTDIHSIGMLNGKQYCRRCISFKGEEVEHKPSYPKKAPIHLEYELSPEQKELSNKLLKTIRKEYTV